MLKYNKLSKKLLEICAKKNMKLLTAESCTGGLLSANITGIAGSSDVFSYGFICYSDESKKNFLNVNNETLNSYGAVSYETCLYMVKNLNKISKTNISVSITGIAGPKGGTKKKPVGLVYIGIKKGNKTLVKKYLFKNKKRNLIQRAAVNKVLNSVLSFAK